jgi:hypothetical protein
MSRTLLEESHVGVQVEAEVEKLQTLDSGQKVLNRKTLGEYKKI